MCSGLKVNMEARYQPNLSKLLEFSATDDVFGFISEVEEKGCDVNEMSYWYGRRIGSRKMGFEERTPILIAAMYGSIKVLSYIVQTGKIDVNRAYGSDGVTALHCAASGGSDSAVEVVKMLLDASADVNCLDANGNRPSDLVASCSKSLSSFKRKSLEMLLQGVVSDLSDGDDDLGSSRIVVEKKEYPIDASLPDINVGLYGTDEFRMYSFKVKPCSRAYSHDWTECPFVHPGENARRRDPKKYHYTCVPCPDFKKGTCSKADNCEYAHGVFESWLHPAQYRTRLCKDETGCARKVCFFAHKPEELRPLYAATGSAMPSPKSVSVSSMDMSTMSPLALGSTPPMSPSACSSPMGGGGGNMWQGKMNLTPPTLQLSGSRLKTALNARDMELELGLELLNLENIRSQQQRQQLIEEMAGLASPSSWMQDYSRMGDMKPTNLDDVYNSMDPSMLSHLQALSPKVQSSSSSHSQMNSPSGMRMRQNNMNQLRASYPSNVSSSPVRKPSPSSGLGFDTSGAVAAAVMNSRSAAFAKRSQSFIDRGAVSHRGGAPGFANPPAGPNVADWGSPDGKLDWGFNGDDHSKLRKSASFGIRSGNANAPSMVKDAPLRNSGQFFSSSPEQKRNAGFNDIMPSWIDQLYIEQEQMVA